MENLKDLLPKIDKDRKVLKLEIGQPEPRGVRTDVVADKDLDPIEAVKKFAQKFEKFLEKPGTLVIRKEPELIHPLWGNGEWVAWACMAIWDEKAQQTELDFYEKRRNETTEEA